MKRFITYLYEYKDEKKIKNVGFLRVDIRGELINIEVCIRNYIYADTIGKLYALRREEGIHAIEWADIHLCGGQCNQRIVLEEQRNGERKYSIQDVVGVAVVFEDDGYVASCWQDEYAQEIAQRAFSISKELDNEDIIQAAEEPKVVLNKGVLYKKIDSEEIKNLPSANWHLLQNSFLRHGAYNYGFLFLKKEMDENEEKVWLGVPGYYEKEELLMALLFGFPEFEAVPKSAVDIHVGEEEMILNIEKNQEPKTGIFGGWFVLLDK